MEKKRITIKVGGMMCSSCVNTVKDAISKVDGVIDVDVNLSTEKAYISFKPEKFNIENVKDAIEKSGYKFIKEESEEKNGKEKIIIGFITGSILMFIMFLPLKHKDIISLFLSLPAFFILGIPIFRESIISLRNKKLNMSVMYAIGISFSYIAGILSIFQITESMFFESSIFLATFLNLGRYLEKNAKKKAIISLKKLSELIPEKTIVIKEGKEIETDTKDISVNDILLVKTGASIPFDGEIIEGETFINESMITGESVPVYKKTGSKVIGGTVNLSNPFKMKVEKIGEETFLSQIIKLVEEGQMRKPKLQNIADKIIPYFIPFILVISIITFIYWFFIKDSSLNFAISRFLSVIVIACPCALGLAIPTAVTVGIGKGAENGIIIKNGEVFEKSEKITTILIDKTGTITEGSFVIEEIYTNIDKEEFLKIVSSLERYFSHPISDSILSFYSKNEFYDFENVKIIEGRGISGKLNGKNVMIGSIKLFKENLNRDEIHLIEEYAKKGNVLLIIKINDSFTGLIVLKDKLKEDAKKGIEYIKKLGIKIGIISGDKKETTENIAKELNVDFWIGDVMPDGKAKIVSELQSKGEMVGFVGDGINDAPALAISDIGIAIGSGTDVAIETGEVVLVKNKIMDIYNAIILSRNVMKKIRQNLFWAFFYNLSLIPVAAGLFYNRFGITLRPEMSGFAMAFSSFTVISISLLIKKIKLK
uniref:Cadmium-translocating P-type ATPase n=1 Tax=candidate division WOR-3 bacterium TaxID=2052148 RepID=A0A7C4Y5E5_UNCW3